MAVAGRDVSRTWTRVGRDDVNVGVRRAASRVVRASAGVAEKRREKENIPGWRFDRCPRARRVSRGGRWMCWCVAARWRRCARRRTRCRPWRRRREIFRSWTCPRGSPNAPPRRFGAADAARDAAAEGRVEDAAAAARDAHVAAESAFFHPDIISLLYFPAEYTLAVYVPLFLPTAFPVLVGLMGREVLRQAKGARQHSARGETPRWNDRSFVRRVRERVRAATFAGEGDGARR